MLYKTVIGDKSSEFVIDNSSTRYVLEEGTTITSSTNGITEGTNWHLNTIQINGTINATSPGQMAIEASGSETTINIGKSGVINGTYGVYAWGDYAHITNNGEITGTNVAVGMQFADHSRFVNNGTVNGEIVADRSDMASIFLSKDSVVTNLSGSAVDLASDDGQHTRLVNHGQVNASSWGIFGRDGDDTVINRGDIKGSITLGDGNDVFDNRGGTVDHRIGGDSGDDTYILSKKVEIYEEIEDGSDTIKSTISMNMSTGVLQGQEIENLTLLGSKNHNATGNELANTLLGNGGNNKLVGLAGADTLKGANGNDRLDGGLDADILTGGKGADTFIFKTGYGEDTVTDFQNGVDHINLKAWADIADFADLKAHHLTVSGSDLVIHSGSDTLTIEHMAKADLDASDFVF